MTSVFQIFTDNHLVLRHRRPISLPFPNNYAHLCLDSPTLLSPVKFMSSLTVIKPIRFSTPTIPGKTIHLPYTHLHPSTKTENLC
ncbi:hypothetical protein C8J55DRAFT_574237 [Lentinula edodes]|uniref:Uncharacterized protein n=1 Tax=Lentinula lateritia TaxID=40482 RepID=A0A9W9ACN5_9AGAR|nr:hypothetical protein C8J55DRAFT_574237 [Lentinula edodes]